MGASSKKDKRVLTRIHIKNFVIVDETTIEFDSRLNVLTGETGAGKSLWVDAVMLALGSRLDHVPVRNGAKQCEITLCFDLTHQERAQSWLHKNDFDTDEDCLIRRIIKQDGKSRSTINGTPCSQSMIREFASLLILTHGQHQHQALLRKETQREQLDAFSDLTRETALIKGHFLEWQSIQNQIADLQKKVPNKSSEIDFLQFQIDEVSAADITQHEWESLSQEHQRAANAQHIIENIHRAIEFTTSDSTANASSLVHHALHQLNDNKIAGPEVESIKELLTSAAVHLEEAGNELTHYLNTIDLSPEKLASLETRLDQYYQLSRKHHTSPEELYEVLPSLTQKLNTLLALEDEIISLQEKSQQILQQYSVVAKKVTARRKKSAITMSQKVTQLIQGLGMESSQFSIVLQPLDGPIHPFGNEQVEFQVSSNLGQACAAINHVVSGGELSRISLAIQVITADYCHPPTMIFDEVDAGIGGQTAEKIGDLLYDLGKKHQVLCITHLAQIASKGNRHFLIDKKNSENETLSEISILEKEDRILELARMLGSLSQTSKEHARSLLTEHT